MTDEISPAERAAAEWDCAQLVHEFALLNDAGEYEKLVELFTADGVFTRPSAPKDLIKGRDAILAHFRSRPPRFSRHVVSNVVVHLETADTAVGRSYLVLYVSSTPAEEGKVRQADVTRFLGTYRDRFARENGRWRFAERIGSLDLAI